MLASNNKLTMLEWARSNFAYPGMVGAEIDDVPVKPEETGTMKGTLRRV